MGHGIMNSGELASGPERIASVGRCWNRFLVSEGSEHMLGFAPTRSGKGVGIVIPNLIELVLDSAIVTTWRGEL